MIHYCVDALVVVLVIASIVNLVWSCCGGNEHDTT